MFNLETVQAKLKFSWAGRGVLLLVGWLIAMTAVPGIQAQQQPAPDESVIQFTSATYSIRESVGFITIGVTRTNFTASTVDVDYRLTDGTAIAGVDYLQSSGTITFNAGETFKTFFVLIFDNGVLDGDRTINMSLSSPRGAVASLGTPSEAVLTIVDDEGQADQQAAGQLSFSSPFYTFYHDESIIRPQWPRSVPGALITIVREGGSRGKVAVDWTTTTNGIANPAIPGTDYLATNGTVTLDDFQMSTNFLVRILPNPVPFLFSTNALTNFYPGTNLAFPPPGGRVGVTLSNPRPVPEEDQDLQPTLGLSNASFSIENNNFGFSFERAHYRVAEDHGEVVLWVKRSGPIDQSVSVRYVVNHLRGFPPIDGGDHLDNLFELDAGSDYAAPFVDYLPPDTQEWIDATGIDEAIIRWDAGDASLRPAIIPVLEDGDVEFNEDMLVTLYKRPGETDGTVNPRANTAILTILFDDQSDGGSDRTFNPHDDPDTDPPFNRNPGANNTVQAVATQPDGKVIIGGDFTAVNTIGRNRIARMNFDGSLDETFNPGTGADNFISAVDLQPDGKVLIGGGFTSFNGTLRRSIARLNTNGLLDTSFTPGLGANGPVRTVKRLSNGKVLVGGEFTSFNGTNINYLARLNPDGSLDSTFNADGQGPNGPVHSIAVTAGAFDIERQASGGPAEDRFRVDTGSTSGQVIISYDFLNIPDTLRVYYDGNRIFDSGQVNGTATVNVPYGPGNSTFVEIVMNEGSGATGTLWFYDLTIDPDVDERPVIGGEFTTYNGTPRNRIARLNIDGSLDPSFLPGTGADGPVFAVAKQGNKVLLGGSFSSIDVRPRNNIARLNVDGSLDNGYSVGDGFNDSVYSIEVQRNGKAVIGGLFTEFNETRRVGMARLNLNGSLDTGFMDTAYNQFAGLINPLSPDNILSQENFIRSIDSYTLTNVNVFMTNVVDTNGMTNQITVSNVVQTEHLFVGGKYKRIGGGFRRDDVTPRDNIARLQGGTTPGPGNIEFTRNEYRVNEDASDTFITLTRTNGSLSSVNSRFETRDAPSGPGNAIASADYLSTTRIPLWPSTWDEDRRRSAALMGQNNAPFTTNRADGDFTVYGPTNQTPIRTPLGTVDANNVFVDMVDDQLIEGDEVLDLRLSSPANNLLLGGEPIPVGTALGLRDATLTIVDNDFNVGTLGFGTPTYRINEDEAQAIITVTRLGGDAGPVAVDYVTSDGTATTPLDYATSQGTLAFGAGQTTNTFTVPIANDTTAELEETINLTLFNPTGFPTNTPPEQRLDPDRSTAVLNVIDDDFAPGRLSFDRANFVVNEDQSEVTITVNRSGGNSGLLRVEYATRDGTAVAGTDYVAASGVLRWEDGDTVPKQFTIPIMNNDLVENDKTIQLNISNPTGAHPDSGNALGNQPDATVQIVNDDAYGAFGFSQQIYNVDENGPFAIITVLRQGGIAGEVSVDFSATNVTAEAGVDFVSTNGTLNFEPGDTSKSFLVPLIDDDVVEGDKIVGLSLTNAIQGSLGEPIESTLTIVDNELSNIPAGKLDTTYQAKGTDAFISTLLLQPDNRLFLGGDFRFVNDVVRNQMARLNQDGTLDRGFAPPGGFNEAIRAMDLQGNGRIAVGGLFTQVNNTNRNRIVRLNIDGNTDPTFNPGAGADNPVQSVVIQNDERMLIAGEFSTFNGVDRSAIARLQTNGVLDAAFDPGTGANGPIFAMAVQNNGKILIGGDFTEYNGTANLNRIARLNRDGSIDPTFFRGQGEPGGQFGANRSVRSILVQPDGKILLGGLFTSMHGTDNINRVARLNRDGTLDSSFDTGSGADGPVNAIALQIDGRILLGGDFTRFDGITRNRVTRLDPDGSVDPTINFGTGANGTVSSVVVQPDRNIIIAGGFTEYNGQSRQRIARIHGGSIAGQGKLEFSRSSFSVDENGTNAVISVRRTGGTAGEVTVDYTAGGPDQEVNQSGTLVFPQAETLQRFTVPIQDNAEVDADRMIELNLANVSGGAELGLQPNATLVIVNDDTEVGFRTASFSVTEDFVTGSATITVVRRGGISQPVTVDFSTSDGTATAGTDYTALNQPVFFAAGETNKTVFVPILDDGDVEGNETVNLRLSNPTGSGRLGVDQAVLNIADNDFSEGILRFSAALFNVNEGDGSISITVRRDSGTTGFVSVDFATQDDTAQAGSDYIEANGTLGFADGETEKTFTIEIFDDLVEEGNETVRIDLSNVIGGATLGQPNSVLLTIVDNDQGEIDPDAISFSANAYSINESEGSVSISVARSPMNTGAVSIDFATSDDTATAGEDYLPVSGTLVFAEAETVKKFDIEIINDDRQEGNETVNITLSNVQGEARIEGPATVPLTIVDDDPGQGSLDLSFDPGNGATNAVRDILLQGDNQILIAGDFTHYNRVARGRVARLNSDGSLEAAFDPGQGPNNPVLDLALQSDGKILLAGAFNTVNGVIHNRVARLNSNGGLDGTFSLPLGLNAQVKAVALQPDGKAVIGGTFDTASAAGRNRIARLNADGTLDTTFDPGTGADGVVNAVWVQSDGKVLVGGGFSRINGIPRNGIARLNANGSVDPAFVPGMGVDGSVNDVIRLDNGKIIIGGEFAAFNETRRSRLAVLNSDGSLDPGFDPASGPNGPVLDMALEPNGRILIGGAFTEVNGVTRNRIARVKTDGLIDLGFDPGTGANGTVEAVALQRDGKILIGGSFTSVNDVTRNGIARLFGDPSFAPSGVEIVSAERLVDGRVRLVFNAKVGAQYLIEATDDLDSWQVIDTITAAESTVTYLDENAPDFAYRFYRIRQLNQ